MENIKNQFEQQKTNIEKLNETASKNTPKGGREKVNWGIEKIKPFGLCKGK